MPAMVHINRLGDFVLKDKRRLFWGVYAAFVVGVVTSTLYTIWLAYTMGAYNFQPNFLILGEGVLQYSMTVSRIRDPRSMEAAGYWLFLAGAGALAVMNLMRYRFIWWPFHPIGFALSGTIFARLEGFTLLVAWLIKFVMIKVVGVSFYRRSRPFFIGMLIGFILAVVAGMVVDAVWFPQHGHIVHQWF